MEQGIAQNEVLDNKKETPHVVLICFSSGEISIRHTGPY